MTEFASNPQFAKLLAGQAEIDLVQFMLEIAADAYPQLDCVGCLLEIDRLGVACRDEVYRVCDGTPRTRLQAISRLLYDTEGFHGNREAYYEPQNSYLNDVLARRCGLPIALGILYTAVAARAGVRVFGVNTPGHFMVGHCAAGEMLFVDPFQAGEVLDRAACQSRIEEIVGTDCPICDEAFRPAAPLEIAARVLRNLKTSYAMLCRWSDVLRVQERLTALLPQIPQERRDLGLIYLRLGQPAKALRILQDYLSVCGCEQAAALYPSLQAARRMIAESN